MLAEELRWRTWASGGDTTGDPLLVFVNGKLLPKLRGLQGSGRPGDPRDTLARVFQDTTNRMLSGHLLRQLVDQVNRVEFSRRDETMPWPSSTRPCCARCGTPPTTPASSTPRVR